MYSPNEESLNIIKIGKFMIDCKNVLGQGHYGVVYLAYCCDENGIPNLKKPLACKIMKR